MISIGVRVPRAKYIEQPSSDQLPSPGDGWLELFDKPGNKSEEN